MDTPRTRLAYKAPRIVELGDLVDLTAQGQGGLNKPCSTAADGLSGLIGNCSGGDGASGIGS